MHVLQGSYERFWFCILQQLGQRVGFEGEILAGSCQGWFSKSKSSQCHLRIFQDKNAKMWKRKIHPFKLASGGSFFTPAFFEEAFLKHAQRQHRNSVKEKKSAFIQENGIYIRFPSRQFQITGYIYNGWRFLIIESNNLMFFY